MILKVGNAIVWVIDFLNGKAEWIALGITIGIAIGWWLA